MEFPANYTRFLRRKAKRGTIYDTNGETIGSSIASTEISLTRHTAFGRRILQKLANLQLVVPVCVRLRQRQVERERERERKRRREREREGVGARSSTYVWIPREHEARIISDGKAETWPSVERNMAEGAWLKRTTMPGTVERSPRSIFAGKLDCHRCSLRHSVCLSLRLSLSLSYSLSLSLFLFSSLCSLLIFNSE